MKISNLQHRWRLLKSAFSLLIKNRHLTITDSMIIVQWDKKENKSVATARSINSLLGLLVAQIALLKNDTSLNYNNEEFVEFISKGLIGNLKKNAKNTPAYEKLHVRKVKMRTMRKYR